MIKARSIRKSFTVGKLKLDVLKGITFDIKKGEFVGLMGPSGSGKSTLLHQLALLDDPTSGEIWLDGTQVRSMSDSDKILFRLKRLGYIFQDYALLPELTALQNVCLPAMVSGQDPSKYTKKAAELLKTVGLGERLDHLPSEMSGGEQQRVSIARSLINSPSILFADEPCANLDSESSKKILEVFKSLNEKYGQTIIMVTHEEWHTSYLDRVIRLKDGVLA